MIPGKQAATQRRRTRRIGGISGSTPSIHSNRNTVTKSYDSHETSRYRSGTLQQGIPQKALLKPLEDWPLTCEQTCSCTPTACPTLPYTRGPRPLPGRPRPPAAVRAAPPSKARRASLRGTPRPFRPLALRLLFKFDDARLPEARREEGGARAQARGPDRLRLPGSAGPPAAPRCSDRGAHAAGRAAARRGGRGRPRRWALGREC